MADMNCYLPDDLDRRFRTAQNAGLIERGFLSRVLKEAVEARLAELDLEAERFAAYLGLKSEAE